MENQQQKQEVHPADPCNPDHHNDNKNKASRVHTRSKNNVTKTNENNSDEKNGQTGDYYANEDGDDIRDTLERRLILISKWKMPKKTRGSINMSKNLV